MTDQEKRPRTWAATYAVRLRRLRRLAAELRAHGWTVEEPPEGQAVRMDI